MYYNITHPTTEEMATLFEKPELHFYSGYYQVLTNIEKISARWVNHLNNIELINQKHSMVFRHMTLACSLYQQFRAEVADQSSDPDEFAYPSPQLILPTLSSIKQRQLQRLEFYKSRDWSDGYHINQKYRLQEQEKSDLAKGVSLFPYSAAKFDPVMQDLIKIREAMTLGLNINRDFTR